MASSAHVVDDLKQSESRVESTAGSSEVEKGEQFRSYARPPGLATVEEVRFQGSIASRFLRTNAQSAQDDAVGYKEYQEGLDLELTEKDVSLQHRSSKVLDILTEYVAVVRIAV